jgi:hypothetical protein
VYGSSRATIDPDDDMIARRRALVHQCHVGDRSRASTLPSRVRGGKSSGEGVSQERPYRRRVTLVPRGLDGHHDRCQLKLEWMLRGGHRDHLPEFLAKLLAESLLESRAKRLPKG